MSNALICRAITIQGIVQGVGFRPFVYRLALRHHLGGQVANTVAGVAIEATGSRGELESFLVALVTEKPAAAQIDTMVTQTVPLPSPPPTSFTIKTSRHTGTRTVLVAPDLATCPDCLAELDNPADRRYNYPFINCTNCGPRYTLIEDLPYDRSLTSMKSFPLCPACTAEYSDPTDRRFHAQPNACPICGPQLVLTDHTGRRLAGEAIATAITLLKAGNIVAIKGLGGFHLAVDAGNEAAIARLRQRKGRPDKPLAIMAADLQAIEEFAQPTATEKQWLQDLRRPIVLLRQQPFFPLAANLAPGIRRIGVMLPYTPIHHLLMKTRAFPALVMTSANLAGAPIITDNQTALEKLAPIADHFLLHDRPIVTSNDDSVLQIQTGHPLFLRRSRSWAPAPLRLPTLVGPTLAVGGAQKNTICLAQGHNFFLSQHLGDLEQLETIAHFEKVIAHLRHLLQITPTLIAHDLHPDYPSSRYALVQGVPTIAVQHHHAHAVSCMAEHRLAGPVLAITLDGSGLGSDGTIWGGEVLRAEYHTFTRLAHLSTVPLPGGEAAIRQPWRTALSYLQQTFGDRLESLTLPIIDRHRPELPTILGMIASKINAPLTSSCGRLFDGVAALLGIRELSSFEGQAAMELEALVAPEEHGHYPLAIHKDQKGPWQLATAPIIAGAVSDLQLRVAPDRIAARFHNTLAHLLGQVCAQLRDEHQLHRVVLAGGVFQNLTLTTLLSRLLTETGFSVYLPSQLPPNDGGLALGQAVAGRAMWDQRENRAATCRHSSSERR